eukprot:756370-Hanusia_phi.AAC.9
MELPDRCVEPLRSRHRPVDLGGGVQRLQRHLRCLPQGPLGSGGGNLAESLLRGLIGQDLLDFPRPQPDGKAGGGDWQHLSGKSSD